MSRKNPPVAPIHVFIAHSSKDREITVKLADALQKRGIRAWYDDSSIKVGQTIVDEISNGLRKGDFVILLLSKHSVESPWVQKELDMSIWIEVEKKSEFVLPVRLDDCEIPLIVRGRKYADFRKGFDVGMDQLLDAIASLAPETQTIIPELPPRVPSIRELVDKFSELTPNDIQKRLDSLSAIQREKAIVEIMDRFSTVSYGEYSRVKYLVPILEQLLRENGRASERAFEIFFREFSFRSLPMMKQELLQVIAKQMGVSTIRNWIKQQKLTDYFITEFEVSGSYIAGGTNSEIIANLGPALNKTQFDRIVAAAISNSQIYESWSAPANLRRLFSSLNKWLSGDARAKLTKLKLL